jgi:hypothetical protein
MPFFGVSLFSPAVTRANLAMQATDRNQSRTKLNWRTVKLNLSPLREKIPIEMSIFLLHFLAIDLF